MSRGVGGVLSPMAETELKEEHNMNNMNNYTIREAHRPRPRLSLVERAWVGIIAGVCLWLSLGMIGLAVRFITDRGWQNRSLAIITGLCVWLVVKTEK